MAQHALLAPGHDALLADFQAGEELASSRFFGTDARIFANANEKWHAFVFQIAHIKRALCQPGRSSERTLVSFET